MLVRVRGEVCIFIVGVRGGVGVEKVILENFYLGFRGGVEVVLVFEIKVDVGEDRIEDRK